MTKKTQLEDIDSVVDINIEQLMPNVIDKYLIVNYEGHHTVVLPMNETGLQFRAWYRGKGGIFSKDTLNFMLGKDHGKYVLLNSNKNDVLNRVARLISEEEEEHFTALNLVSGHIKDKPYMVLKHLKKGESLTSADRFINNNVEDPEEDVYFIPTSKTSNDEDFEPHVGSISLFSE